MSGGWRFWVPRQRRSGRSGSLHFRPLLEQLEERLAPAAARATVTVTTADDIFKPKDGKSSLREAIMIANRDLPLRMLDAAERNNIHGDPSTSSEVTIHFDLANGPTRIDVKNSALPPITSSLIIDAAWKPLGKQN